MRSGRFLSGIEKDLAPKELQNNGDSDFIRHMSEGRILHLLPALDCNVNMTFLYRRSVPTPNCFAIIHFIIGMKLW